ncbi:FAD dependent oxidoreductase-domain-containing protein [Chytridium lagenaria]|nr:FAD dependent oxidoreductase-domain-containing protein [Chytridium lagenaria]
MLRRPLQCLHHTKLMSTKVPFPSLNPLPSYWLDGIHLSKDEADPTSMFPDPSTVPPFDVAIIGGGISGFSTAYHVARVRPEWRVAVLEARDVAGVRRDGMGGCCGQGELSDSFTGLVEKYGIKGTLSLLDFDYKNVKALEDFVEVMKKRPAGTHLDPQLHLFPEGGIATLDTQQDVEKARKDLEGLEQAGVKDHGITLWSGEELESRTGFKGENGKRFAGAVHNRHARHVVPARLVLGLAKEFVLESRGCKVYTNALVVGVEKKEGVLRVKTETRGTLCAKHVVYATNGWSEALLPHIRVTPIRNQVVVTEPVDGGVGGMRYLTEGKEVGVSDDAHKDEVVSKALRRVGGDYGVEFGWVAVCWEGAGGGGDQWIAAGYSGHGMPRAFLSGKAIAAMIVNGKADKDFPADLFAVTRERLALMTHVDGFKSKM